MASAQRALEEMGEYVRELEAERTGYRVTLEMIRAADPVDLALDPTWAQRVASDALNQQQKPEEGQ